MRKIILPLIVSFLLLGSETSFAQCAMCRASLETEGNAVKAEAMNNGIVYLMAIPYLLVAGIGFYVYKTRIKR